ncbi:MAG: hypothetical protein R3F19_06660 [Verrucomicrobiales bacterium]
MTSRHGGLNGLNARKDKARGFSPGITAMTKRGLKGHQNAHVAGFPRHLQGADSLFDFSPGLKALGFVLRGIQPHTM